MNLNGPFGAYLDMQSVLVRFFRALDERQYDRQIQLMASDGSWFRQGKELRGRDAVLAAMHARPAGVVTQHLLSNLDIDISSEDEASAVMNIVVYAGNSEPDSDGTLPMNTPQMTAVYKADFKKDQGRWFIAELSSRPIFRRQ